jgi:hypothetical protein
MNFYQIRTDPYGSRANRSFAYARDYGPLNGEMPFFTPKKDARHSVLDSGVELGRICGHEEVTNI